MTVPYENNAKCLDVMLHAKLSCSEHIKKQQQNRTELEIQMLWSCIEDSIEIITVLRAIVRNK